MLVAGDADQFVEAVCRISSEEGLWERLREQGMQYVESHHNPMAIGEMLYAKYSNFSDKRQS